MGNIFQLGGMLLMRPLGYVADHSSILSLRRLLNLPSYHKFPLHFGGIMSSGY